MALLDILFPCDIREAKVEDFMSLSKFFMLVKEYYLKITWLDK